MLLLVAYDHFNVHFENASRKRSRGAPYMQKAGNRTVTIVRFGHFQVEEIISTLIGEPKPLFLITSDLESYFESVHD